MKPGPPGRRVAEGATADGWACRQLGPRDAWQAVYASQRPVRCNRAPGHEAHGLAHAYVNPADFAVLVEWTDAEVPSA